MRVIRRPVAAVVDTAHASGSPLCWPLGCACVPAHSGCDGHGGWAREDRAGKRETSGCYPAGNRPHSQWLPAGSPDASWVFPAHLLENSAEGVTLSQAPRPSDATVDGAANTATMTPKGCIPCRSPSCSSPSTPFAVLTQSCDFHRYPDANSITRFRESFFPELGAIHSENR
jgi:hypothetical protein